MRQGNSQVLVLDQIPQRESAERMSNFEICAVTAQMKFKFDIKSVYLRETWTIDRIRKPLLIGNVK